MIFPRMEPTKEAQALPIPQMHIQGPALLSPHLGLFWPLCLGPLQIMSLPAAWRKLLWGVGALTWTSSSGPSGRWPCLPAHLRDV